MGKTVTIRVDDDTFDLIKKGSVRAETIYFKFH